MTFKPRALDRRNGIRFEVIGSLPARVTIPRRLVVLNLSCGGLLVESPVPLPESVQTIQITSGDATVVLQARVLRTTPSAGRAFTVAMTFVDPEAAPLAQLRQIMGAEIDSE
jgi:hypothetical protein